MSNKQLYHLIIKSLKGRLTSSESQQLDNWTSASEEHAQIAKGIKEVWELSENATFDLSSLDMDQEFATFQQKLSQRKAATVVPINSRGHFFLKIAASIALVVASTLVYLQINKQAPSPPLSSLATNVNQQEELLLSDGTQVWLNENSKVSYPNHFEKEKRNILLHGEAFFEVQSNPERPFEIQLSKGYIKVLGTAFNVRDIETEDHIEITVQEGKVSFQFSKESQVYILTAKDRLYVNRHTFETTLQKDTNLNALAWHNKQLTFNNESLIQATKELERYFKANISIDESLSNCKISSPLPIKDLESFLRLFEPLFHANVKKLGPKQYQIEGGSCD